MDGDVQQKLEHFFAQYRLIKYKKGEIIYRPGDEPLNILYIKSGFVRLYTISKDGQELTIKLLKPIFYFTLIYAIINVKNKYYVETISPVELWSAPKEVTLEFIKKDPQILFEITKNLFTALDDLMTNIEYLISGNTRTKVASMLLLLASRFGQKEPGGVRIDLTPTHQDIAGLLGTSREIVSIQIKELEKMGIIAKKGRFWQVLDMKKLEEESSFSDE